MGAERPELERPLSRRSRLIFEGEDRMTFMGEPVEREVEEAAGKRKKPGRRRCRAAIIAACLSPALLSAVCSHRWRG